MTTTMAHRLAPPAGQHETPHALHPHQRTAGHGMSDSGSRHIGRKEALFKRAKNVVEVYK